MEQASYSVMLSEVAELLFNVSPEILFARHYEWITNHLMNCGEMDLCEKWCMRCAVTHPDDLISYTCRLKFYFKKSDKERFMEVMSDLRQTNIVIDKATLEIIRAFA